MNISTSQQQATIGLNGRFDAHEALEFRHHLEQLMDSTDIDVSVDLSEVTFVDSAALAELVRGLKRARTENRELLLRSPSDSVRVILELTKLDAAFTVC